MKIEQIQPLHDRLVIQVLDETEEYDGLLSVDMTTAKEPSNIGLIVTLPLGYTETGLLSVGRRVLFNRHSGTVLKLDRFNKNAPEYRLLKEEDIHALISQ